MASQQSRFLLFAAAAHILFATSAIVAADNVSTISSTENNCTSKDGQLSAIRKYQRTKATWWKWLKASEYDSYTPPNYPDTTNVSISMWPFGLSRVDEVSQTIKVKTYIEMKWIDERLAYDLNAEVDRCFYPYQGNLTLQAGDNEQEQVDSKIWLPRLFLHARQDDFTTPFLKIIDLTVGSGGEVLLKAFFQEARLCNIRTKRYPFDMQVCTIELMASQYVNLRHLLEVTRGELIKARKDQPENYETNEWKLFDTDEQFFASLTKPTYVKDTDSWFTIKYNIYFSRKYTQHVINWIVSPIVLSVSSVIGMYRGCEVGERFSFGGTIVVTITLMVNELRSVLGVSEDYPILGRMYIGLEMTLILATLLSGVPRRFSKLVNERKQRLQKSVVQHLAVKITDDKRGSGSSAALQDKFTNYCFGVVQNWTEDAFDWTALIFVVTMQISVISYCVVQWLN